MGGMDHFFYMGISFALTGLYFLHPSPHSKVLALFFNSAVCFFTTRNFYGFYLTFGMLFGSVGDFMLELGDDAPTPLPPFLMGLIAFAIGHVFYIIALSKTVQKISYAAFAVCLSYAYYLLSTLYPLVEQKLKIPVVVYGIMLCTVPSLAISRCLDNSNISWASKLCAAIGTVIFVISDSIIALNKFQAPIEHAKTYVMITYYTAQLFISASAFIDNTANGDVAVEMQKKKKD